MRGSSSSFVPVSGDLTFVRQGGVWIADTSTGEEHLIVPHPHPEEGWNPVAAAPVWHPDGRRLAYLSYYEEDLAAGGATDRGFLTWVDLEAGRAWHRRDLQVALAGGLVWDASAPRLIFISSAADLGGPRAGAAPDTPGGRVYYGFAGDSGLYQIAAPEGEPELLTGEESPSHAYTGPLGFTAPGSFRYIAVSNSGIVNVVQLDAVTVTTKTLATLQREASRVPYGLPTLHQPARSRLLYLVAQPEPTMTFAHGLYSLGDDATPRQITDLHYACGLEAGIWEDTVALGCGGGDSSLLMLCGVTAGQCEHILEDIVDNILASTVGVRFETLNALKIMPVHWSAEGCLYITAIAYTAGQPWSGGGHLLRFCPATGDVQAILSDATLTSFSKE